MKPKTKSNRSGPSQTDEQRAERGVGRLTLRVPQRVLDKFTRDAERAGVSRAVLFARMVLGKKEGIE